MWYGATAGRRLDLTLGKPRGVARRVRALERWARDAGGWFPDPPDPHRPYLFTKIPTLSSLVEGPHSRHRVRVRCAQALIDACAALIEAKPPCRADWRVTCLLSLPDLFSSEVCIYTDEANFLSHTGVGRDEHGEASSLEGRSLAREWGLVLPPGIHEIGRRWDLATLDDAGDRYVCEHWHYGEVGARGQG